MKTTNILIEIRDDARRINPMDYIKNHICKTILKKYNAGVQIPLNSVVLVIHSLETLTVRYRIMWNKALLFDPYPELDLSAKFISYNNSYILSDILKSRGYI